MRIYIPEIRAWVTDEMMQPPTIDELIRAVKIVLIRYKQKAFAKKLINRQ